MQDQPQQRQPIPITLEQLKQSKEHEVIQQCAQLWNTIIEITDLPQYDNAVLNEAIHRIQDLMYTRLFIKQNGSF